jgi:hypothetical protein
MATELVITPGGPRPADRVHEVKPGHVIDQSGGRLRVLDEAGNVVNDYGLVAQRDAGHLTRPDQIATPLDDTHGLQSGWITYASWLNNTGQLVSNIVSTWTVPAAPTTNHGQTIFLFNGIETADFGHILQPVLQWGPSAAGGGASWQVASWYAGGPGQVAQHAPLTPVSVGQTLVGGITWTNESGAGYTYLCGFQGIPNSVIVAQNIPELTWVVQTLETYNCQVASDYPDTTTTKFTSIGVDVGSNAQPAASLAWAATDAVTDIGQNTVVVGQGEVDINYT